MVYIHRKVLIISLVVFGTVQIPITILLIGTVIEFGRIDLIIYTFVLIAWFPNLLIALIVYFCLIKKVYYKYKIAPLLASIVLVTYSLHVAYGYMLIAYTFNWLNIPLIAGVFNG